MTVSDPRARHSLARLMLAGVLVLVLAPTCAWAEQHAAMPEPDSSREATIEQDEGEATVPDTDGTVLPSEGDAAPEEVTTPEGEATMPVDDLAPETDDRPQEGEGSPQEDLASTLEDEAPAAEEDSSQQPGLVDEALPTGPEPDLSPTADDERPSSLDPATEPEGSTGYDPAIEPEDAMGLDPAAEPIAESAEGASPLAPEPSSAKAPTTSVPARVTHTKAPSKAPKVSPSPSKAPKVSPSPARPTVSGEAAPGTYNPAQLLDDDTVYRFSNKKGGKLVASGAKSNAKLALAHNTLAGNWIVENRGNGTYTLRNLDSNLLLSYGSATKGANVSLGGKNVLWCLVRCLDGALSLVPKLNDALRLNVTGGRIESGGNLQLWTANGSAAQRFFFTKEIGLTEALTSGARVGEGVYAVKRGAGTAKAVEVRGGSVTPGAKIGVATSSDTLAQRFTVSDAGHGLYILQSAKSELRLDGSSSQPAQRSKSGLLSQLWYFVKVGKTYSVRNAATGKAWAVSGATLAQKAPAKTASQQFILSRDRLLSESNARGVRLEDGVYAVRMAKDNRLSLDVKGAGTSKGADVRIWTSNGSLAQKVMLSYQGSGLYTVRFVHSGAALDVAGGSRQDGANVQQWASNGTRAQLWYFVRSGSGYAIRSAASGLSLDVRGGRLGKGTTVQLHKGNGTAAQCFRLSRDSVLSESALDGARPDNGIYTIRLGVGSNLVVEVASGKTDNAANVRSWTSNGSRAQKVELTHLGFGLYTVRFAHSGRYLAVEGGKASGDNVAQAGASTAATQRWYFVRQGNGYVIKSALSGLALDVTGGKAAKGTNVRVWNANGSAAQRWNMARVPLLADGTYELGTELVYGGWLVLDVSGSSKAPEAKVALQRTRAGANQRWVMRHVGDGAYTLANANSGLLLSAAATSAAEDANVRQGKATGSDAQRWVLGVSERGGLTLRNKATGRYLDVKGAKGRAGSNVQQWAGNGSAAQGWVVRDGKGSLDTFAKRMVYYTKTISMGYDQDNRWDFRDGGECDCSSLTIQCLMEAGFEVGDSDDTHNMSACLTRLGWKRVSPDISGARVGDILFNDAYHACVVVKGSGWGATIAQASIDENGWITGGRGGDQTGGETWTRDIYVYRHGWSCILRYTR